MFRRPEARLLVSLLVTLLAGDAAAADTFDLGDGHSAALEVASGTAQINGYSPLAANAAAGSQTVEVIDPAPFSPGDLVMIHQSAVALPGLVSGTQTPVVILGIGVGTFELARVAGVDAPSGTLGLVSPLESGFLAAGGQVVRVPEYTTVHLAAGASLTAAPWDGSSGGVLAFLSQGCVQNDGRIDASFTGSRGGQFVNDGDSTNGCVGLDEIAPLGGQRGEGLAWGRFGPAETGYGNVANAGGGGNCHNAGGGGGGHWTQGGRGGRSWASDASRDVGGLGGAALRGDPIQSLFFGGGGGAGHGNEGAGQPGGRGGGIVFVRADCLSGTGTVASNGEKPPDVAVVPDADGGGGGGAGGSLHLRLRQGATCGGLEANGGDGSSLVVDIDHGPGGGGGAGRILLQAASAACAASAFAGEGGTAIVSGGDPHYGTSPDTRIDQAGLGAFTFVSGGYLVDGVGPGGGEVPPLLRVACACGATSQSPLALWVPVVLIVVGVRGLRRRGTVRGRG